MKKILVLSVLILGGCANRIVYSANEHCALQNLTLAGVDSSNSNGSAYNYMTGGYAAVSSSSRNIRCNVPQTPDQWAEIQKIRASISPLIEYNDTTTTGNWLIGTGYIFYIAPGYAGKLYYDSKMKDALRQYQENLNKFDRSPAAEK